MHDEAGGGTLREAFEEWAENVARPALQEVCSEVDSEGGAAQLEIGDDRRPGIPSVRFLAKLRDAEGGVSYRMGNPSAEVHVVTRVNDPPHVKRDAFFDELTRDVVKADAIGAFQDARVEKDSEPRASTRRARP